MSCSSHKSDDDNLLLQQFDEGQESDDVPASHMVRVQTPQAKVPAIRYSSPLPVEGAAAALPSRQDDHNVLRPANASATAAVDQWPTDVLGPKPHDPEQHPCRALSRGKLPMDGLTTAGTSVPSGVQHRALKDPMERSTNSSKPTRTPWSASEIDRLREMVAVGSKPAAMSLVLNAEFHQGRDVRNRSNVAAACRRLHRKQYAGTAETASAVLTQANAEYVVDRIMRKRWRVPMTSSQQPQYHYSTDIEAGNKDLLLGSTAEYEVKWLGYHETSWESVESLTLCIPAIDFERLECDRRYPVRAKHPLGWPSMLIHAHVFLLLVLST